MSRRRPRRHGAGPAPDFGRPSVPIGPPGVDDTTRGGVGILVAAALDIPSVFARLDSSDRGLSASEAARRLVAVGANVIRSHRVGPGEVLIRQLRNPLLLLLLGAAAVSGATGDPTDAAIITVIVGLSVGLGFFNEYRSEQAVAALHSRIRHRVIVIRGATPVQVDVADLVPGDVVMLALGDLVPADLRLSAVAELECDEAVLTGEPMAAVKSIDPIPEPDAQPPNCVFMGSVVHQGSGRGVVVGTGAATAFGRIAIGLSERPPETAFESGLRRFSTFLVRVAGVLTVGVFVANLTLHRPLLDALLFSLAIAIGLTPQLLPAIVTVGLSAGSRRLAERKVLVKRLVSIEDLGNITTLFTDKTGTLTEGHVAFREAIDGSGQSAPSVMIAGLVCNEAVVDRGRVVSANQVDGALWDAVAGGDAARLAGQWVRLDTVPFDHERRVTSVLAEDSDGRRWVLVKGEPEAILAACSRVPEAVATTIGGLFSRGDRVIAVARRRADEITDLRVDDEHDLDFIGFLVFSDPPKASATEALRRLAALGIDVKIITGDNDLVARTVCTHLGLEVAGVLTGAEVQALDDEALAAAIVGTTIFARVGPDQKSRIVRVHRSAGADVGFLGDGVNDAVALHHADVGISVDTATDVAKDAADILLLENDLGVLADGVVEGRRIFANTIKYVLMATSSNFGNMFSAAGASLFLKFLPMLPSQILLNNLLYDVGQMALPTDRVDDDQLGRPAQWDLKFIRRFMVVFGPMSSVFDFATFAVLLGVLHAGAGEFRTGWFIESLATQTLVVFVIRTKRIPFVRSRPSAPLLATTLGIASLAAVIPFTPVSGALGFDRLPPVYFVILAGFVIAYLLLVEVVKWRFYASLHVGEPVGTKEPEIRRIDRRASWFDRRTPGDPTRNRKRRTLVVLAAQWIDRGRRRGGGAR